MRFAEEIRQLHARGFTQKSMASELGCGLTTVRRRMREQGLKGKSNGSRSYRINNHIFDIIDSEEKAYWLGFFLADACIAKSAGTRRAFRLSLKKQDERHVRKAAKFLKYKGKFHCDVRDGHPRVLMVFNDVRLCKALMDHGWWNYKTGQNARILQIIPEELRRHFIRGYFDGDGCISYGRRKKKCGLLRSNKDWYLNIVCKYEAPLEIYSQWMAEAAGIKKSPKKRKSVYVLTFNGNRRLEGLLEWLYADATIYLERKLYRKREFNGILPFAFNNICNFRFNIRTDELIARKDSADIIQAFTSEVLGSKWKPPKYDYDTDLEAVYGAFDYLGIDQIAAKSVAGNKFVLKHQPMVWHIRQNNCPALASFASHVSMVERAIYNFCTTPGRALTPHRFVRELRYAGFSIASLLPVSVLVAALKYFDLRGKWFDPCAGWGNRLLTAHIYCRKYEATDPGICFDGLVKMNEDLRAGAVLHNKRWQDLEWPECDFVLTSPPFHNKENYLDGVEYGSFEEWYIDFLKPLVLKSAQYGKVIFHVDRAMRDRLEDDFEMHSLPIVSGNRHKAPKEFFVHLGVNGV